MITNFEGQTHQLTGKEKAWLQIIIKGLLTKAGKENVVTAEAMCRGLLSSQGIAITGPRIRKIINYIRNNNLIKGLVATSEGYYISNDPTEVATYIESLAGRESAIANIRKGMSEYLQELRQGQSIPTLFTDASNQAGRTRTI